MELFETLSEFLKDKSEMILLVTTDGTAYVGYFFENVCSLKLQGANETLCDAEAQTFATFLSLCGSNILSKSYV